MEWVKLYHNKLYSRKMTAISRVCSVRPADAIALYSALLVYASENENRGSLDGIDIEEFDIALFYGDGTAKRLFTEFVRRGVITSDNRIEKWYEEQERPALVVQSADYSTERVRRFRERQRALKQEEMLDNVCNEASDIDETLETVDETPETVVKRCETLHETPETLHETLETVDETVDIDKDIDKDLDLDLEKDLDKDTDKEKDLEKDLDPEKDADKKDLDPKNRMSGKGSRTVVRNPGRGYPVVYPEDFERFWHAYPVERREEKAAAFKGWKDWLKRGAKAEQMISAAANYGRIEHERGTERRFIKMASTFLGPSAAWQDYAEGGSQLSAAARRQGAQPDTRSYDEVVASLGLNGFGFQGEPESYSARNDATFDLSSDAVEPARGKRSERGETYTSVKSRASPPLET